MRFAVITYIPHSRQNNSYYSYAPYIREMDLWFKQAEEVLILAPKIREMPEKTEEPYKVTNLKFFRVPAISFTGLMRVIPSLIKFPYILYSIFQVMWKADHIHLRCPGNISLLGCLVQIFFPKKPKTVKYAGNWDPEAKQPWTYKLQKKILSNTFLSRNIKVLVYGDWPSQGKNIVPFFTASLSEKDRKVVEKNFISPYKFIYTGNLVEGKGVFEAIKIIEALNKLGVNSKLEIYGDGILKDALNDYLQKSELQKLVKLKGRKSLDELKEAYRKSHFVILLSKSEGWPKAIAEGMWYGCIPIATPVSCVPWMLGEGSRGILFHDLENGKEMSDEVLEELQEEPQLNWFQEAAQTSSENVSRTSFSEPLEVRSGKKIDLTELIRHLKDQVTLKQMSFAAQEWSQQYTLEKFESEIKNLLAYPDVKSEQAEFPRKD